MDYPPGPWTADIIQMIVKERVARIKANLENKRRSVANAQVVKTQIPRMEIPAAQNEGA
jgi:hypothetical protein